MQLGNMSSGGCMSDTPLVTVIVPVYNVKSYVEECVNSIIAQTYSNLEIIIVDDGSTDGSSMLCDKLGSRSDRVTVLHKENGGLADARNYGLKRSHGSWIAFVDSDDWVSPVFIEALVDAALSTGCQMASVPSGKAFMDGDSCVLAESLCDVGPAKVVGSAELQRMLLYQQMDTAAPWRLYTKTSLGEDPFPRGLYFEDLAAVYRIVRGVDKIAVLDCRNLYAYRQRSSSIIHQDYLHIKGTSVLAVCGALYRDMCSWYPELADAAASRCFSACRMVFAQVPKGNRVTDEECADRKALWDVLKRFRKTVLHDSNARRRERLAAAIACVGEWPFSTFCTACRKLGLMR
jgi:glycosyltransferase involved in cell wall biosynthesis